MNENKITYFSTGEFAKLFKVNKKTLFHYDDIDLFKPEKISPNGYRYYSHNQIEIFSVIHTLRDIGMPLKKIRDIIDNRDSESIIDIFEYEIDEIERKIDKLKRNKKLISNKIKIIKEGQKSNDTIRLEEQDEEYFILSNSIDNINKPLDIKNYILHLNYCYENEINIGYGVGMMIDDKNLKKGNFNKYSHFYTKVDDSFKKETYVKPKGVYVVGYLHGYFNELDNLYKRLLKYIEEKKLRIIGYSYESILFDAVVAKERKDYIIKVSIQVENL